MFTTARIWFCKYKNLAPLENMSNLEVLVIAGYPDDSFGVFERLTNLRYLSIIDMPKVSSLLPLQQLKNLTALSLSTLPSWDSKRKVTIVDDLSPLLKIPKLAYLELHGICPASRSPDLLRDCRSLKAARFSHYDPKDVRDFFSVTGVQNSSLPDPVFGSSIH